MIATEIHKNAFGGWWVDVIEVCKDGNRIVDEQSFLTYWEAEQFCKQQREQGALV